MTSTTGRVIFDLKNVNEETWNKCAIGSDSPYNPFVDYRFLRALEDSGSVKNETGWQPFHIVLESDQKVVATMPMYLKSHSRGEFVFDGAWAQALHEAGGKYYPKMQCSVPFTPATGSRLLCANSGDDSLQHKANLLKAAQEVTKQIGSSSIHITFLPRAESEVAKKLGFLERVDTQFHWINANYSSFEDFIKELSAKKRKNLRRERRDALSNDVHIEWLTGSDLREEHWDVFFEFYLDTGYRKWGMPYLNREFFSMVSDVMSEQILLVLCKRGSKYIAGALHFIGEETLFGRYWGSSEYQRFLHFEASYYQAIDFAIERGLKYVEAGAQGGHKFARGYLVQPTYSVHWLAHENFRDAVDRYLQEERNWVRSDIDYLERHTPYRRDKDLSELRSKVRLTSPQ